MCYYDIISASLFFYVLQRNPHSRKKLLCLFQKALRHILYDLLWKYHSNYVIYAIVAKYHWIQTCSKNLWHILIRMLITSSSYFVKLKYLCNSGRKSWHEMTCVETLLKQFMAYLTLEVKQLITSWQSYVSSYLAQKSFICILLEGTHIHISVLFHSPKLFIIINLIHESTCS